MIWSMSMSIDGESDDVGGRGGGGGDHPDGLRTRISTLQMLCYHHTTVNTVSPLLTWFDRPTDRPVPVALAWSFWLGYGNEPRARTEF